MTCVGRQCSCQPGTTLCGQYCTSTAYDPNNCGGCGVVCTLGKSCVGGSCVCSAETCGSECVSPSFDPAHCRACFNACGPGEYCD